MTKIQDVKAGDLMAVVMYAKVRDTSIFFNESISCVNVDTGDKFDVHGKTLVEAMFSADRFTEEKKVTKTEMAEVLSHSYNVPFTVTFVKQEGETRKLRGRLIEPETLMGRCKVEDLDEPKGKGMRLVDNRTLLELIVKGVKYTLKK